MKKLLWILVMLSWCNVGFAEDLQLICKGSGSKRTSGGSVLKLNKPVSGSVIIKLTSGEKSIQIPSGLLPTINRIANFAKKDKKNKFKLKKVKISDKEISGIFMLNPISKPAIKIDRYTGILYLEGIGGTFNGECEKIDLKEKKF
jgi:hypothetical protein